MGLFLPKQIAFFELLEEISEKLIEISELLVEFGKNPKDSKHYAEKAKEIEHQADKKAHEVIDKLNKTFITPIDREDIYLLAHQLDDIIDIIENVIHNIMLYNLTADIQPVNDFAPIIEDASRHLKGLLDCLRKQKYDDKLMDLKIKIHELEDKADGIFDASIVKLFAEEKDPATIIKLKDILEDLESAVDKFQEVSNIIEGIVVKST